MVFSHAQSQTTNDKQKLAQDNGIAETRTEILGKVVRKERGSSRFSRLKTGDGGLAVAPAILVDNRALQIFREESSISLSSALSGVLPIIVLKIVPVGI